LSLQRECLFLSQEQRDRLSLQRDCSFLSQEQQDRSSLQRDCSFLPQEHEITDLLPQHIKPLPSWPSKVPWNGAKRRENHLPNHTMKTRQCSSEETTYLNEMPCLLVPKWNMEHVEHISGCCVGRSLLLCRPELIQDHWKQYKYPAMFAF
jgi:hypothetical protein